MELAVGASAATIKSLLTKLGGLLAEEYALIRGVRGDVQFINDELASMQAFLSNLARAGGADGHDDQTRDWMKQVRDVSYDIEDCVDDFTHSLRPDPRGDGCLVAIRRTLYEIRTSSTRRAIAAQIVDLKARAQQVGERRGRYGVRDPGPGKPNGLGGVTEYHAAENQQITRQLVRVQEPVGVESDDMKKLPDWIVSDNKKKLSVLSIVGFGGVGKTTVALDLIRKYGDQFQRRAMVTVSQNSDPELVLKNILGQVKPQANDGEHQGEDSIGAVSETKNCIAVVRTALSRICLQTSDQQSSAWDEMHKGLKAELDKNLKTRYLLLIDDVWSSSTWQIIRRYFPDNENGSRIIVTTRFPAVATTCSANEDIDSVHKVNVLLDDESQTLFQKSISECNVSGDNIPDRVWKMCGGLPLAIVTMAGLVASTQMRTWEEWIKYLGGYSLQTLVIDDESSDFLSMLDSMPAPPTYLSALELSGKLLKLPEWFPGLNDLTKLTLSATVLGTDNLVQLSKLRSLFSLTFSVSVAKQGSDVAAILEKNRSDTGGEIFLPAGGFSNLKLLRIFVPLLPSFNFSRMATPQLERIELRFKRMEGLHGMDKLGRLRDVLLTVDGEQSEPTKSILEDLKRVSSKYTLIVNEYHD
ncbi:hypothetical protein BAE44_0009989 [Dichanthelium oligosanthes]|uniref:Disease resistance protein RPM1 n=1 Tax=Dichanthelium oligosanthes TaxID=888268 RepID=A0A1E5VV77_9POAL|nr:hypothetical protein BAE44_0009989 [Dichanthelium oligosanthes]